VELGRKCKLSIALNNIRNPYDGKLVGQCEVCRRVHGKDRKQKTELHLTGTSFTTLAPVRRYLNHVQAAIAPLPKDELSLK
jgi:hypothetical protein